MNNKTPSGWSGIVFCLSIFASILFSILWLREKEHKPKEIIKEIEKPVEVIKEVEKPIEVVKEVEVPVKLTSDQIEAIKIGTGILNSKIIESDAQNLIGLRFAKPVVQISEELDGVLSKDRIQNKLELLLNQHDIKNEDHPNAVILINISGIANTDKTLYVYIAEIQVIKEVFIAVDNDFKRFLAPVWKNSFYGTSVKKSIQNIITVKIEDLSEALVLQYLKNNLNYSN